VSLPKDTSKKGMKWLKFRCTRVQILVPLNESSTLTLEHSTPTTLKTIKTASKIFLLGKVRKVYLHAGNCSTCKCIRRDLCE